MIRRLRRRIALVIAAIAAALGGVAITHRAPSEERPRAEEQRRPRDRDRDEPRRDRPSDRPKDRDGDARQRPPRDSAPPGLVVGEYRLARVIDGDTVRVDGLDASLRLIGIDAEETFKSNADRRDFESASWADYLAKKRGDSKRPIKAPTPMGDAARTWGSRWFTGDRRVRIERDHPAEIRDRFDRYLAYVMAEKDGRWVNYNVELVRAGMSPYFPKYGNSRRFHREFVEAEAEAKAAKRGIWEPGAKAYPDYPEREAWWTARGDFVAAFRREGEGKPGYIDITHEDALAQLQARVGQEVHVLGTIDDVSKGTRGPGRLRMMHDQHRSISAVFAEPDVLARSGAAAWRGEFVVVTGVPRLRGSKKGGEERIEIAVERASQLRLSPVPGLPAP